MSKGADAPSAKKAFELFVAAINRHDVEAMASLMTPDHLFVDSLGNRVQGAESMRTGWHLYFAMCPDYWIRVRTLLSDKETVLASGEAGGTIASTAWETPVAWQAIARGGRVSEWRVFADNKPVYELLAGRKP
jgi:ketosteroid isomerase-like protein